MDLDCSDEVFSGGSQKLNLSTDFVVLWVTAALLWRNVCLPAPKVPNQHQFRALGLLLPTDGKDPAPQLL